MTKPIYYYSFHNNLFVPWDVIYPECRILRDGSPNTFSAMCFRVDQCPGNKGCMEVVTKRVMYWYDKLEPLAKGINAYFKHGDSIGTVYFPREMTEPRLILPANPSAFKNMTKRAIVKSLVMPGEYYQVHSVYQTKSILPVIT